jgi:aspergillopepsin I
MVYFNKITAVLAAFSAVELATALPTHNKFRSSFTVNQIAKPASGKPLNIPAMYANTIAKYGGTVPDSLKAAADNGSVVTTPTPNDVAYLSPVTVGSSTLHLDFDTGSSDL